MLQQEKQAIEVFRRVRDFLTAQPPRVGYGDITKLVQQLTSMVGELETNAREQDARGRQSVAGTRAKQLQVAAVRREFLRPVARAAQTIFASDGDVLAALTMPRVRGYVATIAAAESVAQTVVAHKAAFVEFGFPEDFVEKLQQSAADLRTGIDFRATEFGKRTASTAGLRNAYRRGRRIVRMLDAMVGPRLEAVPERLAEWRTLSKFARRPRPGDDPVVPPDAAASLPPQPTPVAA